MLCDHDKGAFFDRSRSLRYAVTENCSLSWYLRPLSLVMGTQRHRRWGLIFIHDVCKREGLAINRKRTLRVYREQKLQTRHRPRSKKVSIMRAPITKSSPPNQVWSMDFIHDRREAGRKVKVLNVVDDFSRICVG
jgi:transposase InsO family protein